MTPRLRRYRDDQIGGSRPVNQLVEPVQPAEYGNGVRPGTNGKLAPVEPGARGFVVSSVHETDDRDASLGVTFQMLQQLASIPPGTDENDPTL